MERPMGPMTCVGQSVWGRIPLQHPRTPPGGLGVGPKGGGGHEGMASVTVGYMTLYADEGSLTSLETTPILCRVIRHSCPSSDECSGHSERSQSALLHRHPLHPGLQCSRRQVICTMPPHAPSSPTHACATKCARPLWRMGCVDWGLQIYHSLPPGCESRGWPAPAV